MAAVRNSLTDRLRASLLSPPPLFLVFLLWEGKWIHNTHSQQVDFVNPSSVDVSEGSKGCGQPGGIAETPDLLLRCSHFRSPTYKPSAVCFSVDTDGLRCDTPSVAICLHL